MSDCQIRRSIIFVYSLTGKSHYLFMVWFAYDEATYITDSEYKDTNGQVNLYLYCYIQGTS